MARSISSLVADNIRTSASSSLRLPTGQYTLSCNTLSSSVCISGGMFPISSRKSVPPLAVSKYPAVSFFASVNAPCTWPKNSDAASSPPDTTTVHRHKRLVLTPAMLLDQLCDRFFPATVRSKDHDGTIQRSHTTSYPFGLPDRPAKPFH